MTTSSRQPKKLPHAWVLYVAAIVPLATMAFAFSLGPSPAKRVQLLRSATVEEAEQILNELEDPIMPYLVNELLQPGAVHQHLILQRLTQVQDPLVNAILGQLSEDTRLSEGVRSKALSALESRLGG